MVSNMVKILVCIFVLVTLINCGALADSNPSPQKPKSPVELRNIITVPLFPCPSGERRDAAGRCTTIT